MKINPIAYSNLGSISQKPSVNYTAISPYKKENLYMPLASEVLSFFGGHSMSLAETLEVLDKLQEDYDKGIRKPKDNAPAVVYPPGIRDMIVSELKRGNPDNKTLIDIHLEKYAHLCDLEYVEDIVRVYPEFYGLLSDSEFEHIRKDSLISRIKRGELEHFDPEGDVAVQLMQLYWGQGFSMKDINNRFTGQHIQGSLIKLGIPIMNSVYGIYLKNSDKNYNKRMEEKMSKEMRVLWQDEEYKKLHSEITKERWKSPEYRALQSEISSRVMKEKWKDEEFKKSQSESISKAITDYDRKRRSEVQKKSWTPERRAAQSKRNIERWAKKGAREKMSETMTKLWQEEEFRNNQAQSWTPERRQIMSESTTRRNIQKYHPKADNDN